jgi:hypothetical protein
VSDEAHAHLTRLLAEANDVAHSTDLRTRLQWLEDAALAAEACDLGEHGARGALDLKAALGATLRYAKAKASARAASSHFDDAAALDQLEALVRTLIERGTSTLFAALADEWSALAGKGPMRAQAQLLADALRALSLAAARGEDPPATALAQLADVSSQSSRD